MTFFPVAFMRTERSFLFTESRDLLPRAPQLSKVHRSVPTTRHGMEAGLDWFPVLFLSPQLNLAPPRLLHFIVRFDHRQPMRSHATLTWTPAAGRCAPPSFPRLLIVTALSAPMTDATTRRAVKVSTRGRLRCFFAGGSFAVMLRMSNVCGEQHAIVAAERD